MILLDKEIEDAQAERSLLMAYAASPSHLETGILRALQQKGDGRVTVLVDHSQYRAAFTERGVRGPGVHYRFYPVRLPRSVAAFHPKLYLLAKPEAATLLVASANLTRAGWRRNAEVVDRLTVQRGNVGDVRAFIAYADFLGKLAVSSVRLPDAGRMAIKEELERLRELIGHGPVRDEGPWFLHNLERPLLEQLREIVPQDAVTDLTVISPYFDEGNVALRALAAAYPKARRIRVIKNEEDLNNFSGVAAKSLRSRLKLFYARGLGDKRRYIHGKSVLLSGPDGTWTVAGSANATAPAWLRAAVSTNNEMLGNLEAITVRRFSSRQVVREFCAALGALDEVADWHELRYEAPAPTESIEDTASPELAILLLDAEVVDGRLLLRMADAPWAAQAASATVVVECTVNATAGRYTFNAAVETHGDERARIDVPLAQHLLRDHREPAIVTVDVKLRDGSVRAGRAWLMQPALIDTPAPQREFEYATDAFSRATIPRRDPV